MKIDKINDTMSISPINATKSTTKVSEENLEQSTNTQNLQHDVQVMKESLENIQVYKDQEIDLDKVQDVKARIAAGELTIDVDAIAKRLLDQGF